MGNKKSKSSIPPINLDRKSHIPAYFSQKWYKPIWMRKLINRRRTVPVDDYDAIMMTNDILNESLTKSKEFHTGSNNRPINYPETSMENYYYDISTKPMGRRKNDNYEGEGTNKSRSNDKYNISSVNPVGIFENPEFHSGEVETALENVKRHNERQNNNDGIGMPSGLKRQRYNDRSPSADKKLGIKLKFTV